jgi:NADH-quinone oxidoreductase subunit N
VNPAIASLVQSYQLVLPEIVLVAGACVLFLGATFRASRNVWPLLALLSLAGAAAVWRGETVELLLEASSFRGDSLVAYTRCFSLAAGALLVLLSWRHTGERHAAEYHASLLLIIAGVTLAAAANDLIVLFLALELVSIPTYLLLYLPRHDRFSQEAATKYFLLSVFSSALVLYGFSFLYGVTGTTNLELIRGAFSQASGQAMPGVLVLALVFALGGLCFRLAAVPFHFYAPDVYQGAPTMVAGLLAVMPKLVGFAALLRVVSDTLLAPGDLDRTWSLQNEAVLLIWIVAAATMTLGNVLGLLQDNLKRLLAYSSIAHSGYMLVGLGVGRAPGLEINGVEALLFYLVVYGIMTLGAFGVLSCLSRPDRPAENIDDLAGLGQSHPLWALAMALFLFSLIGLPPTAGFVGKLGLFLAAWSEGSHLFRILALVMAVNAAAGAWYYLRVIGVMYLRSPVKPLDRSLEVPGIVGVGACAILVVALFLRPGWVWTPLKEADARRSHAAAAPPSFPPRSPDRDSDRMPAPTGQ